MEELSLLNRLLPELHFRSDTPVGPGDDCAALDAGGEEWLLAAADHLIADVHFFSTSTPMDAAGAKLFNRNASDIAAMGGIPRWCLLTLAANGYTDDELLQFSLGAARAAEACQTTLVGGDISSLPSPGFSATLTILGGVPKKEIVTRSGARPGDVLCVTGSVGNSLSSGHHLHFRPRLAEGRILAEGHFASAMLDISDGLLLDAKRLAGASGVRIVLDPELVPLRKGAKLPSALGDGEDYELLFTVPAGRLAALREKLEFTVIGNAEEGRPSVETPDGRNLLKGYCGYEHGKH